MSLFGKILGGIGGSLIGGGILGPIGSALGGLWGSKSAGGGGGSAPAPAAAPAGGPPPVYTPNVQSAQLMPGGYNPSNPLSMPGVRDYTSFANAIQGSQGQALGGEGPASGTINQMGGLAGALQSQMKGRGPSLAGNLLEQAQQRNAADAASFMGSQRGLNRGLAARTAGEQATKANTAADAAAAQARIQEQLGAQQQLAGVLGQTASAQLGQQGTGIQALGTAGGLQNAENQTGMMGSIAGGQLALGKYNADISQNLGLGNLQLGTEQLSMQPYLAQMGQNFQQSVLNQQMQAAQHTGGLFGSGGFLGTGINLSEGGEVPGYDDGGEIGADEDPTGMPGSASAAGGADAGGGDPLMSLLRMGGLMNTVNQPRMQMGGASASGTGVGGPGDPQVINPNYNPYQGASDRGTSNLLGLATAILPFLAHGGEVPGPVPEAKTMDDKDYKRHGKDSNGKEKTQAPPSGQSGGEVPGYAKGGYTGLVNAPAPNPTMPAPMAGMGALPSIAPLIPKPTGPLDMIANALPILATMLPGNLGMIAGPVSSILANQFGVGDPSATNLGMYAPLLMMMKRRQAAQQQRDAISKIVKQGSNETYTGEPGSQEGAGSYASDKIAAQPDEANYPSGAGETAGDAHGGEIEEEDGRDGGHVPGKAKVQGDNGQNDTVPAMLSPGEIVIPRSIAQHPDAPNLAADFVAQIRAKKGEPSGYGKVVAAKERAARGG